VLRLFVAKYTIEHTFVISSYEIQERIFHCCPFKKFVHFKNFFGLFKNVVRKFHLKKFITDITGRSCT
jgi:hypothetical protein